jgi:hypothetical protein
MSPRRGTARAIAWYTGDHAPEEPMYDVTPEVVRAMADAAGIAVTADDAVEIAHRIGAFLTALAPLSTLGLADTPPLPVERPTDE